MNNLTEYINDILGQPIQITELARHELPDLPFYLRLGFSFYNCSLLNKEVILVEAKDTTELIESGDIEKIHKQLEGFFEGVLILVLQDVPKVVRKRLVGYGINFIVPYKQMYLPALLIDFNETFRKPQPRNDVLTPSAQMILLYHLLNQHQRNIEEMSFKEIAELLGYSQMGITKAVEVLKYHDLCRVEGGREKHIQFPMSRQELWIKSEPFMINPVLQKVYIDDIPPLVPVLMSGLSALPLYGDLNEIGKQYIAVEKNIFYGLSKSQSLPGINDYEGNFCLEVWKYDPLKLIGEPSRGIVDPLSLFLSLRDNPDERIQIELEKLINGQPWYTG